MVKNKKLCFIIIAALLVCTMLMGCGKDVQTGGNSDSANANVSKEVTLTMYLIGDPPKDYKIMLEELNKLIKKDINAILEVKWLGWGEWKQRYPLLAASGEPYDLIYTSDWAMYRTQAKKGAFLELDDILPQYAPKSYSEQPKAAWEQVKEKGKIYMVPMNYKEVNPHGYVVRGDLRKKYNIESIITLDDFGRYLDAIANNESGITPYNAGSVDLQFGFHYLGATGGWDATGLPSNVDLAYKINEPSIKLFTTFESNEYEQYVNIARNWYLNGYWSKDTLVNRTAARDSLLNGKSAAAVMNLLNFNELYLKVKDKNPEWELEWYEIAPGNQRAASRYTANGVAIGANSKNPERALMLLELFRNNEEYFNLTTYGIKGKHYELTSDGKLTLPEGVIASENGFPPDSACAWGWRQEKYYRSYVSEWPKFSSTVNELRQHLKPSKTQSFIFNEDNIKNELAAINSVKQQYEMPLMCGAVDPKEGLAVLKQKMKEAVFEKVKAEVEKQLVEYLKNNK